ncbi:MAG TPA: helix-turn-helix transcriptional regulator [Rhodanobacteraceae bacterium]|nr:helix-turn-helix transcriptional regulator [Rhodanobacteraceae bacterium]
MNAPKAGRHLSWKDQDAIIVLWHELAEFPASAPQAALGHCLHALARQIGAVNATWVGVAREKDWARKNPRDPLLGWRPNVCLTLHPTDEWQRAHEVAVDAVRNNYMDPQTVALASRFGHDRCLLREEVVTDRDWKRDRINREVLAPLGIGHRLIGAAATAPGAESYFIFDRGHRGRGFGVRERNLLAFFLRGSTLLHREMLQMHGLLNAFRPLSPRERDVLRLLLTGAPEKELARTLHLTPATTHQYVVAVLRNFGAHSRAELMAQWLRRLAPSPALPTDQ